MRKDGSRWKYLDVKVPEKGPLRRSGLQDLYNRKRSLMLRRERERDERKLRASGAAADADVAEGAIASWDPYAPGISECDMAVVPGEGCMAEEPKGCTAEEPKPDGSLCAMCLFAAMQKGKESTNVHIEKALTESQKRYLENGYKELEKLTHENYEQSH
eukprot:s1327_g15.t1